MALATRCSSTGDWISRHHGGHRGIELNMTLRPNELPAAPLLSCDHPRINGFRAENLRRRIRTLAARLRIGKRSNQYWLGRSSVPEHMDLTIYCTAAPLNAAS